LAWHNDFMVSKYTTSLDKLGFRPDPGAVIPIYAQLAAALSTAIRDGRIAIGSRLPSERDCARALGLSRTTVTSAYQKIKAIGLTRGYVGRGAIVIANDPDRTIAGAIPWQQLASRRSPPIPSLKSPNPRRLISFGDGWLHPSLVPHADLAAAASTAANDQLLFATAAPVLGLPALQDSLSQTLHVQNMKTMPGEILVTGGAQQGLHVIARALISPGDTVVCESATWYGALHAFRAAGADVVGIAMDHEGVDPDALEDALARLRPKLVYLIPSFHCPTGRLLGLQRRRRIVEMCARFRTPIVESHVYGDLTFGDRLPSLLNLAPEGLVIQQGSASKSISPALRLGWLVAPRSAMELLASAKSGLDLSTSALTQAVLAGFLKSGANTRHQLKFRNELRERRDALIAALATHCPELRYAVPQGGIYLWAQLPRLLHAPLLEVAAAAEGVSVRSGDSFLTNGAASSHIRLCFAAPARNEIVAGAERLGKAVKAMLQRQRSSLPPESAFASV
jgi:DNA-binding transcriptional MocR family regulator